MYGNSEKNEREPRNPFEDEVIRVDGKTRKLH